jgi:hypothetical protein
MSLWDRLKEAVTGKPQASNKNLGAVSAQKPVAPRKPQINAQQLTQALQSGNMGSDVYVRRLNNSISNRDYQNPYVTSYKQMKMKDLTARMRAGQISRPSYEQGVRAITQNTFDNLGSQLQEMTPRTPFDIQDRTPRGVAKAAGNFVVKPVTDLTGNISKRLTSGVGGYDRLAEEQKRAVGSLSETLSRADKAYKEGKIDQLELLQVQSEYDNAVQALGQTGQTFKFSASPVTAGADVLNAYLLGRIPAKGFQAAVAGSKSAQGTARQVIESSAKQGALGGAASDIAYNPDANIKSVLKSGAIGAGAGIALGGGAYTVGKGFKLAKSPEARQQAVNTVKTKATEAKRNANPALASLLDTRKQAQIAFDRETNPARRAQINKYLTDLNQEIRQQSNARGGFVRIGKDSDIDPLESLKQEARRLQAIVDNPSSKSITAGQYSQAQRDLISISKEIKATQSQPPKSPPTDKPKPDMRTFEYTDTPMTAGEKAALRELEGNQTNADYSTAANELRQLAKESGQPELYKKVMGVISDQNMSQADATAFIKQGLAQMRDSGTNGKIRMGVKDTSTSAKPTLQDALEGKSTKTNNLEVDIQGKKTPTKLRTTEEATGVLPNQPQPISNELSASLPTSIGKKTGTGRLKERLVTPSERTRGFVDTVVNDPKTSPKVKENLTSLYSVRNTKQLQTKAANLVKSDPDLALRLAREDATDTGVAVGSELIKKLQADGNYETAIDIAEDLATKLTRAGQTAQAASIYGRLTPEGVLRFTQRELQKFNLETGKKITLSPAKAEKLVKLSTEIEGMADGYEKQVAIAKLVTEIQQTMPATKAQQASTLQTLAQLLNPKTNIRNVLGNSFFGGLENVSQSLATPVDKLLGLFTGTRTTGLPSLTTQGKGVLEGGRKGVSEAFMGINTGANTQFDLNSVPVFRGKVLGSLEKTMNATLRGADRAAYTAAFDDTIRSMMKVQKLKNPTSEILEQAHLNGLYRTFQDENLISDFFVGMKRSLNKIGVGTEGRKFGLGDLVLKYPKTPANLLARGIDYSPAGFVKAIFEATKPLTGREFNQKSFVDAFSRAVVGSGAAFGTGFIMAKNGIITAQPEDSTNLRNLQKAQGLGGYQINASALKRWVMSGFNEDAAKLREGDTLVSYDWAQPIAIPVSAGATLGAEKPKIAGSKAANAYLDSVNTLVEQPLLQGVQRLFGGQGTDVVDAGLKTLQSAPASFSPTALNQIGQLLDNTSRNTSASGSGVNGFFEGATNQIKAKVPFVSKTLPENVDVLGNTRQRYQDDSNNPFNVFLNPAFVNKFKPSTAAQEPSDLYKSTGETKQLPNTTPKKVTVNGKDKQLTGKEQADYQRYVGQNTSSATEAIANDPRYKKLSDPQKVNILSNIQTDINAAARISLFGDKPDKVSESVDSILTDNLQKAIDLKLTNAEKANAPKAEKTPKISKPKKAKIAKAKSSKGGKRSGKTATVKLKKPKLTVRIGKVPSIKARKTKTVKFSKLKSSKTKRIKFNA